MKEEDYYNDEGWSSSHLEDYDQGHDYTQMDVDTSSNDDEHVEMKRGWG